MDHADDWIQVQMIREPQHLHWWKELKALYRGSVGDLSNAQAPQLAQWQAAAFQLPVAQEEASGWWKAPHNLHRLCHWDFISCIDPPA